MGCTADIMVQTGSTLTVRCELSDENARLRGELFEGGVTKREYEHSELIAGVNETFDDPGFASIAIDAAFLGQDATEITTTASAGTASTSCSFSGSISDLSDDCLVQIEIVAE